MVSSIARSFFLKTEHHPYGQVKWLEWGTVFHINTISSTKNYSKDIFYRFLSFDFRISVILLGIIYVKLSFLF